MASANHSEQKGQAWGGGEGKGPAPVLSPIPLRAPSWGVDPRPSPNPMLR